MFFFVEKIVIFNTLTNTTTPNFESTRRIKNQKYCSKENKIQEETSERNDQFQIETSTKITISSLHKRKVKTEVREEEEEEEEEEEKNQEKKKL